MTEPDPSNGDLPKVDAPHAAPSPVGAPAAMETSGSDVRSGASDQVVSEERSDAPTPIDPNFRLDLPGFEGPLDLLLFLIKKHELDVLDLPIAFVASRYAEYLSLMEQLNLDVAGEYLVMAATLAHIKSKSLLPKPPEDQDDEEEDEVDPREELIRRLLEYQKYKRLAEQLGARGVAGRDVFPRGIPAPKAQGEAPLADVSVFKLIDAFQKIIKRHDGQLAFEIDVERISIQERMGQITELVQRRERLPFQELFDGFASTYDLVVTFLALLEMAKMRLVRVYQGEPDGPIYLEPAVLPVEAEESTMSPDPNHPVPAESPESVPMPDSPMEEPANPGLPNEPPVGDPPAGPPLEDPPPPGKAPVDDPPPPGRSPVDDPPPPGAPVDVPGAPPADTPVDVPTPDGTPPDVRAVDPSGAADQDVAPDDDA